MTTGSAPAATAAERLRASSQRLWDRPRTPWIALAALCVAALAAILYSGRGLFFFGDEWAFLLHRRGISTATFLNTHNEHPSTVPVAAYKLLLQLFGMTSYFPYRLAVALLHLATGVLVFLYARRRLGDRVALVPAALMLFLGAAWEDVMWAFQIGFIGSTTFGLLALVALDGGRRRDWLACLALVLSVTSSGLGVPFLLVVAIEIAFDPARLRRAWVIAVPAGVLAIILVGFSTGASHGFASPSAATRWALEMASAAFGALFGGNGVSYGRPLLLAAVAVFVLAIRRGRLAPGPRLIALICGALAYWFIIGSGRATIAGLSPDSSRYVYASSAFLLAIFATSLDGVRVGRAGGLALAVFTAFACVSSFGLFKDGPAVPRNNAVSLPPKLAALEVARGHVPAPLQIDVTTSPDILASSYFSAIDAFGTPAPSIAQLRKKSDGIRQFFDIGLAQSLGLTLAPTAATAAKGTGTPPQVERATAVQPSTDGSCVDLRPSGAAATADLVLPAGTHYRLSAGAGAPVTVQLRRLADSFGPEPALKLDGGAAATLDLPRDRLGDPWRIRLTLAQPVQVCTP
jgi:hypothetical protein